MGKECELLHLKFNHEGGMGKTKVLLRSDTEIINSPHPLQEYFFFPATERGEPCRIGHMWHQENK